MRKDTLRNSVSGFSLQLYSPTYFQCIQFDFIFQLSELFNLCEDVWLPLAITYHFTNFSYASLTYTSWRWSLLYHFFFFFSTYWFLCAAIFPVDTLHFLSAPVLSPSHSRRLTLSSRVYYLNGAYSVSE